MTAMKDLSEARRIVEQQRGEIERLRQEVTMLRKEYAADTVEIAKLNAMIDEQRQDLSSARSGWEQAAEALREADATIAEMKTRLAEVGRTPTEAQQKTVKRGQIITLSSYGRVRFDRLDVYFGQTTAKLTGIDNPGTYYPFPAELEREGYTIIDA